MLPRIDLVLATPPFGVVVPLGVGDRVAGRADGGEVGLVSLLPSAPDTGGFFSIVDIVARLFCYVVGRDVGESEGSPDKMPLSKYYWSRGGWVSRCPNNDYGLSY